MKSRKWFAAIVAGALMIGIPAWGQTFYGSVLGTVVDASAASVPGSAVTLTNTGTAERRTIETDASGNYQFLNLVPGQYRLEIDKAGFKHFTRNEIRVEVQSAIRIDVTMEVGDVGQTVEISAQSPLLQTDNSALGQVVESRMVQDMPLNGRNPLNLAELVPGVVPQGNTLNAPVTGNNTGWGNYQIGGGIGNQSAAFMDGAPLNVGYVNMVAMVPSQDAVQEFRVQTNNLSPEFGRFAGGIINLTTKSGTNDFHGTAYEFLRNRVLNANTFFNNENGVSTPAFTQNQFGAAVGGPVRKDRTFFFASYEGFRLATGSAVLDTVPTLQEESGDFSTLRTASGSPVTIYDPLTTCGQLGNAPCGSSSVLRTPFPGNIIPASRINPTSKDMFRLWAPPNLPGNPGTFINNFARNVPTDYNTDQLNFRGDENVSAKQHLFARYSWWNLAKPPSDTFENNTGGRTWQLSQQAVLGDTYSFTPNLIGDIRLSYLRYDYNSRTLSSGVDLTTFGLPAFLNDQVGPLRSDPFPIVQNMVGVLTTGAVSYIICTTNVFDASGSFTKIAGPHSIKFGMEWRVGQFNYAQSNDPVGDFTFDNLFTASNPLSPSGGNGVASFLLGMGASGSNVLSPLTAGEQVTRGLFVTDTWQANRKLTLTGGVRWELIAPWTERHDRISFLLPYTPSPFASAVGMPGLLGSLGVANSSADPSRYGETFHKLNFGPRLGFAYRPWSNIVLRGGYAIFFLPNDVTFSGGPYGSPVNNTSTPWLATSNSELTAVNLISNPFPNGIIQSPGHNPIFQNILFGLGVSSPIAHEPYPYAQQWNFDIQKEMADGLLVDLGYAGSKGTHLQASTQQLDQLPVQDMSLGAQLTQQVPNPFFGLVSSGTLSAPTVSYGQLLRPYPQYNGYAIQGADNRDSIYHSMQAKVEKRFRSGGAILAAYTFAKLISDTDQLSTWLESTVAGQQNYYNNRGERSVASQDVPQRLVVSGVVDLPFGPGKRFLANAKGFAGKAVSGWTGNAIVTLQSGYPLGLTNATNLTQSFGGGSRPNSNGQDAALSTPAQQRLNEWFNTADFTTAAPFTFGNVGRNLGNVRGAGVANWDVALFKSTTLAERLALQFRVEVFNLFNRVQFGLPGTAVGIASFGVISTQANQPRLFQLSLRLTY